MLNVKLIFVDTNHVSIESILASSFLTDLDVSNLARFKNEEIKKEKACSLIFKNKFIDDYQINEYGKPISDSCYFNISHSKGVVVFVKDSLPLGVDIEKIRPVEDNFIDYISSKEEKEYIKSPTNFYEIWTNKESLIKNTGTGIKKKVNEIPALPINGNKEYEGKKYYSKTMVYKDYVISITRETDEPFDIEIEEEGL